MHKSFFIPLVLFLGYLLCKATPPGDFAGYYFGSLELWNGNLLGAYDTATLNLIIDQKGLKGVFVSYTPFPPFTALAMAPFLWMPMGIAKLVFNSISALLFVITLYRACKFFSIPAWMVLVVPVIFCIPIRNNIVFGQSYLLLTVLLLEGFMAYKKGRLVLAAVLWSFAMVFKIFPVCVLFYLLAKRDLRQFWFCVGGCIAWGFFSLACTGLDAWQYYVFELLPRLNNGELNDGYTYVFQSAFMLLKNLLVYDAVQNADVVFNSSAAFIVANVLYKASILAACVATKSDHDLQVFGIWLLGSLLISPNGSSYSLILLVVPLLGMKPSFWAMALLLVICNLPVQWFRGLPVLLQYPRLYLLLAFYIMNVSFSYKPALAFAVLLFVMDLSKFFEPANRSNYLLSVNTPLIYDYTVKQQRLVYYSFDSRGRHEVVTGIAVNCYEQLPAEKHMKKPMLINGNQVVYLSDKGRGVGFYSLRVAARR